MATLHFLGTGAAYSDPHRTTTMLAVADRGSVIVIDCGGDVVQRLLAAGIDLDQIEALIITHEHPDHVGGFPLFMEKIWLSGRRRPIAVYGIAPALAQAQRLWASFDTESWPNVPPIDWREVDYKANTSLIDDETWHISASPVVHTKPCIGLRIESRRSGAAIAYSCDTEPTANVVALARNSAILVHEATGEGSGHSSAAQAADVAGQSGAERLILVHLPPANMLDAPLMDAARRLFPNLALAEEGEQYEW